MKNKLKLTILFLSLMQMGCVFMGPIMQNIVTQFPEYSTSTCQMLMTIPNLVVVVTSLIVGKLSTILTKKQLLLLSCFSMIIGSLGLFVLHTHLLIMFVFSGLIGFGVGILLSVSATMISKYYTSTEQSQLYGIQNTATSVGGVILSFLSGYLATIKWYYAFLYPLIIIPGTIMTFMFVPSDRDEKIQSKQSTKITANIYYYTLIAVFFLLVFNIMPTNIAIYLQAKGLGDSSVSGIISAVVLCGGAVSGMCFKKFNSLVGERVIALGFFNLALGFFLLSIANNLIVLGLGAFIGGCSLPLLMSRLTLSISLYTAPAAVPVAMSLIMAGNNLGNFISPIAFSFIPFAGLEQRFLVVTAISLVFAIISYFTLKKKEI